MLIAAVLLMDKIFPCFLSRKKASAHFAAEEGHSVVEMKAT